MNRQDSIFVAGHRGLVGSAIVRALRTRGFENLFLKTHNELDLTDSAAVKAFFDVCRPRHVFLAAAKVGGIAANNTFPAEFIRDNLAIQTNVIHESRLAGVDKLLFLGSSCIYPKLAPQPLREASLLSGPLEPTNRPYAVAKIAGIEMCWSYNRQYGTRYLAAMPTNLYGYGDNYDLKNSHVLPALIRKFHEAKLSNAPLVEIWGTGEPRREFMFAEDAADACVHMMCLDDNRYAALLSGDEPPLVNVGVGTDLTIRDLAFLVRKTTGYQGDIVFDPSQPDGTPRKLMDISRLTSLGWKAKTDLAEGIALAYADFQRNHAAKAGA